MYVGGVQGILKDASLSCLQPVTTGDKPLLYPMRSATRRSIG
jgi:hypothetical protein